jgi:GntR family transcriptional regulator
MQNTLIKPDNRPLYDQAIDALNRFIEQKGYKPGDRLPGEGELAKQLGISRPTLREAMGNLESRGVVERRHGVGTFVTAPAQTGIHGGLETLVSLHSMVTNAGVNARRSDWVINQVEAPTMASKKLNIASGSRVVRVQMTMREANQYIAYFDSYIPEDFLDIVELRNYDKGSLLDYLFERNEAKLSYTNTNLYSVSANEELVNWMRVPSGKPLLLLEETFYSDSGKPIEYSRNYFATDDLNFHIIRRVIRR